MPHLTLEYSANLEADFGALCQELAATLVAQRDERGAAVYPIGGVRVRALRCDDYCIADGAPDAGFVHGTLKIAAGRSDAVKRATGDALFDAMKRGFERQFAAHGLALSLAIQELDEGGTWKHNNLHQRFRKD
ncbi:5-carboxymethyl-2-hydroxymuconate Delta-isomerase [Piscinibacter sp. XHJ-5]|uniref:5-carboxymethyl-2-hydroxymuconate Delta-isomerase n=1 Tax=Piscinibacter sp. XHJ-5 TaxID=3037797 RepID=UPI0024535ED0|nr:5-carboxymethyl-2-hydroxymuconate Delta-isomerase [Piscinibacter sp. XHJ-5]